MAGFHADPPARPLNERTLKEFKESGWPPTCRHCGAALKIGEAVDFQFPHDSTGNCCKACAAIRAGASPGESVRMAADETPGGFPSAAAPGGFPASPTPPVQITAADLRNPANRPPDRFGPAERAAQERRATFDPAEAPSLGNFLSLTAADLFTLAEGFPWKCPVMFHDARHGFVPVRWGGLGRAELRTVGTAVQFIPDNDGERYVMVLAHDEPPPAARGLAPDAVHECPPLGLAAAVDVRAMAVSVAAIEVETGDLIVQADRWLCRVMGRRIEWDRTQGDAPTAARVVLMLSGSPDVTVEPMQPVSVLRFG